MRIESICSKAFGSREREAWVIGREARRCINRCFCLLCLAAIPFCLRRKLIKTDHQKLDSDACHSCFVEIVARLVGVQASCIIHDASPIQASSNANARLASKPPLVGPPRAPKSRNWISMRERLSVAPPAYTTPPPLQVPGALIARGEPVVDRVLTSTPIACPVALSLPVVAVPCLPLAPEPP